MVEKSVSQNVSAPLRLSRPDLQTLRVLNPLSRGIRTQNRRSKQASTLWLYSPGYAPSGQIMIANTNRWRTNTELVKQLDRGRVIL